MLRLVIERIATYQEIMTYWDICDVFRANELLDIKDDAEWRASQRVK